MIPKTGEAYPAGLDPCDPHCIVGSLLDREHAETFGFWNPDWKVSGHNHVTEGGRMIELEETHSVDLGGKIGRLVIRFPAHGVPIMLPQLYVRCLPMGASRLDGLNALIDQTRDFLARLERARYLETTEVEEEGAA